MLPNTLPARTARRLRLQVLRGRVGLGLVAGLSVLAGMTDAIGLLALGDFVSFMSGNTTRLAVAISEADLAMVLRLSGAVLGFVAGNALGVLAVSGAGPGRCCWWSRHCLPAPRCGRLQRRSRRCWPPPWPWA